MCTYYPGSLHNHTDFSNFRLRDCITKVEDLIDYAIELGHEVVAVTEHETVANAIRVEEYYEKIKADHPNFKVIRGNEIYLCRNGLTADNFQTENDKYFHFILLAKDAIGHQQIRELSTQAWTRSYVERRQRRVPTYYQDLIDIIGPNPGHVIASSACLGGFIPVTLLKYRDTEQEELLQLIKNWCSNMVKLFGDDCFYLEMQPSKTDEQIYVNKALLALSQELNIPYIISLDEHYLKKEDAPIHKAFLQAQEGEREVDSFYASTYLMDTEELESYFSYFSKDDLQTAYQNIIKIKNDCVDYSLKKPLRIPQLLWRTPECKEIPQTLFEAIPYFKIFQNSDFIGDKILIRLLTDALNKDERLQNKETYDEVNECLKSTWQSSQVNKTHWSSYFLNLQCIIDKCWEAGTLVGVSRGSGGGFLLLYLLGITQMNPMWEKTRTYRWRFLNPERVSVLDIDTDIESSKRGQVLQALRQAYGSDHIANVITFGTEGSRSAIQTAARGLGLNNDLALSISSLVPADRGLSRTLKQCFYGDPEEGFNPIPTFVQQMKRNPQLWIVAQKIEGLICQYGQHAGGVIFVDEPFVNSTALMKAPSGDMVTQFELGDCEKTSLIKYDLLSIEALDKIHICLDLLIKEKYIEQKPTLKETYESVIGVYKLERTDKKMWELVWDHKIRSLFQMEKESGIQGISLTHPASVDDLAHLNSVIRLMAPEKGTEQPLSKYARFKNNINLWYEEMAQYGLTPAEQKLLEPVIKGSYGICESQEGFMRLVQIPECGGFDLNFADSLRKAVAKKKSDQFDEMERKYYEGVKEKHLSPNLCNYVWQMCVRASKGYGFNLSHTLAYSIIALQEMNLAFRFPIIFWNCACLIAETSGGNDYNKMASIIGKMRDEGIDISLPDVNTSQYTFWPDVKDNKIYFGLSGIMSVGEEIITNTINNRPYVSIKDYYNRVKPDKTAMISLIKGGAFDSLIDRRIGMGWFIWETCDKKKNLTLQNMSALLKYNLLPQDTEEQKQALQIYLFTKHLRSNCKLNADVFSLQTKELDFLAEHHYDDFVHSDSTMLIKTWDKIYQQYMNVFRNYISANKERLLTQLNDTIFTEAWNNYATGSYAHWEMKSLCFYYHPHELLNVDTEKYGLSDFFKLPEKPIIDQSFRKGDYTIKLYRLFKIYGTCIAKNKEGIITLLTPTGVVNVKLRKEHFALYDKQISQIQSDGTKKVVEKSWFERGSMLIVQGFRDGESFTAKKYASRGGHQLYKITSVDKDGNIILRAERSGEMD